MVNRNAQHLYALLWYVLDNTLSGVDNRIRSTSLYHSTQRDVSLKASTERRN